MGVVQGLEQLREYMIAPKPLTVISLKVGGEIETIHYNLRKELNSLISCKEIYLIC
jgi:hypothetical protein